MSKALPRMLKLAGVFDTAITPEQRAKQIHSQEMFQDILDSLAVVRYEKTRQYGDAWMKLNEALNTRDVCGIIHDIRRKYKRLERVDQEIHLNMPGRLDNDMENFLIETLQDIAVYCGIGLHLVLGKRHEDQR